MTLKFQTKNTIALLSLTHIGGNINCVMITQAREEKKTDNIVVHFEVSREIFRLIRIAFELIALVEALSERETGFEYNFAHLE